MGWGFADELRVYDSPWRYTPMRTNIVIDDKLMRETLRATGLKTKREVAALRRLGVTVRKTIDTVIATRCIESGYELLHDDRDFDPFAKYLGLRVAA